MPVVERQFEHAKIAVLGLGYVGLPLAVEFGKKYSTVGYDVDHKRIDELRTGLDRTNEVPREELLSTVATHNEQLGLTFSHNPAAIADCDIYVVTVPTPLNQHNQPDVSALINASERVGEVLQKGDIVIYESTVYPGLTEEVCVPVLEKYSGQVFNEGFTVGYSPERINPGDQHRRLTDIVKITSGSTLETADTVDALYNSIVDAGTCKVSSIKVAEAAKVIENTQRDVNIALINELSMIFRRMDIDTQEVLSAAGTKWNFLNFQPGLVGGHCIGIDPYYLTYKAMETGYHPEMILAGRRINDNMGSFVAIEVMKLMTRKRIQIVDSRALVVGLTFKENCPDTRNTRVVDVIDEMANMNIKVDVFDPWVCSETQTGANYAMVEQPEIGLYDSIILAVSHRQFIKLGIEYFRALGKDNHVLFDIKAMFDKELVDGRL